MIRRGTCLLRLLDPAQALELRAGCPGAAQQVVDLVLEAQELLLLLLERTTPKAPIRRPWKKSWAYSDWWFSK